MALSFLALIVVLCGTEPSSMVFSQELQQPESYIRLHYTKTEHMVPMRDGVKLFTSVFVPRDTTKKYPILMKRTPYNVGPYGEDKYPAKLGPSELFVKAGYIFVNQDVRGRFASEGEFLQVTPHVPFKSKPSDIDESSDTYDTIEWMLKNIPQHNGRVGMYGISYPGFYAAAGMIDAHPALKAVSPQAPVGDWYFDDFLHHGSFFLAHAFRWLTSNATERPKPTTEPVKPYVYPTPDGYKLFLDAGSIENINKLYLKDSIPFWKDMMEHPNRDEFWQKRAIMPHLKNVAPAVMTVTVWYDAEDLYGSFKVYQSVEAQNPKANNVLVVGPWHHGGWASVDGDKLGNVSFGSKTGAFYREHIELPFFEKYLKDKELPARLEKLRQKAVETNKEWAKKLGIPQSAAVTCVKPSGTVSQLTDAASGIHPRHDHYYFRRIRSDNKDPLTTHMKNAGVPNEPDVTKVDSTTVFTFPIKAPKGAITRNDMTAIEQLELWLIYQGHWCEHKPSVTITVTDNEWPEVGAWVWKYFDEVSGISFLPHSNHTYQQAPYQDINKEEYDEWVQKMPASIAWENLSLYELEDTTSGTQALACVAGECELVDIGNV